MILSYLGITVVNINVLYGEVLYMFDCPDDKIEDNFKSKEGCMS